MNRKLTLALVAVCVVVAGYFILSKRSGNSSQNASVTSVALSDDDGPGNALVKQAIINLKNSPPFTAEMSHEVDLYGVQVRAPGRYMQMGQGTDKVRFELKAWIDEELASLLRVSDGRFLYSRIALPGETRLMRVDLEQLNRELDMRIPTSRGGNPGSLSGNWMFGGLAFLLTRLDHEFSFAEPEPDMLGQVPVWRIKGQWKLSAYRRMVEMQTGAVPADGVLPSQALPEHIPTSVELVVGRDMEPLLFPYQVRFLREKPVDNAVDEVKDFVASLTGGRHAIATLEFEKVSMNVQLDEAQFIYEPGNEEVEYRSNVYLHAIQTRFPDVNEKVRDELELR